METKPKENREIRLNIKDLVGLHNISFFLFFFQLSGLWICELQFTVPFQRYTRWILKPSLPWFLCSLVLLHQPFLYLLFPGASRRAIANDLCGQHVLVGVVQWIWSQTDLGMHLNTVAIFFHQHFDTGDSYYLRVSWQFILQVEMLSFCFKKMKSPSRTSAFFSAHLISRTQIWDFFPVNKHNLLSAMVKIFWHKVIQSA